MAQEMMRIVVPQAQERTWKTLEQVLTAFSKEQVLEIVHRYCDAQDHARNYRQRAQQKQRAMKQALQANPQLQAQLDALMEGGQ